MSQSWSTFVRNHAQALVACDFCVVVTATFRLLYVFVLMEHATRRILHTNVTAQPTVPHYNGGRPHMSLGPGIPQPSVLLPVPVQAYRHRIPPHLRVVARPILGGLHHAYGFAEQAS